MTKTNKIFYFLIIVVIIVLFIVFYINKNNKKEEIVTKTQNNTEQRVTFDTNTSKNIDKLDEKEAEYYSNNNESVKIDEITQLINDWKLTKDFNLLNQAAEKTNNTDNEAFYYAWVDIIENNTNDLYVLAEKNLNNKTYIQNINNIFTWFIDMSGEYEKLDKNKKSLIKTTSNKIATLLK